jgi:hypothetical protein
MPRTVIVGYASNPDGGLLQLIIGEALMETDGTLNFSWIEQLSVGDMAPALYPVPDEADLSFDAEPEPDYEVVLREEEIPKDRSDD